jgi:CBS domain-containing protein/anti-sigma regulatory factor (Ser/Thr protein kinase)
MSDRRVVSRTQELVYELTAASVMTQDVITIAPDASMSALRGMLRENRISGVPVVSDGVLVGMVSVEDFINWLAEGAPECRVADRMVRSVVSVRPDDPLVLVVHALEEHGFGRLPVLDATGGAPVGIITKGDIIAGLLHAMEVSYHADEVRHYRSSHLFEDISADSLTLTARYHIGCRDIRQGGEVSSRLKQSLRRLGVAPDSARRAAIATCEAEMNVIIYAEEGDVTVTVDTERIAIEVRDRGPGISDIAQALQPGYSTAPAWVRELGFGAGMGLPNIRQCAETFSLESSIGAGTCLRIGLPVVKA